MNLSTGIAGARRTLRPLVTTYRHLGVSAKDVALASYPKSGNTWIKMMLAHLMTRRPQDFESVEDVIPYVGMHGKGWVTTAGGRLLKSHETWRRAYRRAIYVVRDGRDVAVSYYYQWRPHLEGEEKLPFSAFLAKFLDGTVDNWGAWHASVAGWLDAAAHGDILVVRYEDVLDDPAAELARMGDYLGIECDDALLEEVVAANSKSSLKRKEEFVARIAGFVRKGVAGDWRNHFSPDDEAAFARVAGPVLEHLGYETAGR